jgi:hypothetical protein
MLIGTRAGLNNELTVAGHVDAMHKRVAVRCLACGTTMVVGCEALATGAARCVCSPLTLQEREALRSIEPAGLGGTSAAAGMAAAARCNAIVRPVSRPDQQLTEDPDRVRSLGCNKSDPEPR